MAVDSGTYTDATLASRRRLAEAMLQKGGDYSPISSPWQGLARVASGLMGGYGLHKLGQEEKAQNEQATASLMNLPGLGGSQSPAPGSPAPMVQPPDTRGGGTDFMGFVKKQEGWNPNAYGDYKQTSIGYGTKARPGETSISPDEGEARLRTELSQARQLVQGFGVKLSPKQEDALTDLTFNTGTKWMTSGLGDAIRAGDWARAQQLFQQYVNAGGKPLPGLIARRQAAAPWLADTGVPQPDMMAEGGLPVPPQASPMMTGATPQAPVQMAEAPGQTMTDAAPDAAQIKALIANPRTRAVGLQLYQKWREQQTKQDGPTDDIKEYRFDMAQRMQQGQKPVSFQDWIASKRNAASPKSGLTPHYARDKDGNIVPFVLRNDGTVEFPKLGEGMSALGPGGIAEQRALGTARGEAKDKLAKIESDAAQTLKYIEDVETDPNLDSVIGPVDGRTWNFFNQGVQAKVDQLKGRAFQEAFNSLKGGGAITEREGEAATNAMTRLGNQTMSQAEYREALKDFKTEVRKLVAIARQRAEGGGTPGAPQRPAGPAADPLGIR
jgi:lysozyme